MREFWNVKQNTYTSKEQRDLSFSSVVDHMDTRSQSHINELLGVRQRAIIGSRRRALRNKNVWNKYCFFKHKCNLKYGIRVDSQSEPSLRCDLFIHSLANIYSYQTHLIF